MCASPWDLPYGIALRAVRPREDAAPDLLVAIPLPEAGRYRISMIAPDELAAAAAGGTGHGIQSEARGPDLAQLQAVVDDLLPERPVLSDLRWSSLFRISMRLASHYRVGRAFIAGDAAHIHPPTGGQGMNTGIQDAYNLAWKLALVLDGAAEEALLESYEAERRPVGAEVVARTLAASMGMASQDGGMRGAAADRRADTQIDISYRDSGWVRDDGGGGAADAKLPLAGDRAPDAGGLRRRGLGFPLRLFDVLRGTEHVLIVHLSAVDRTGALDDLAGFAREMRASLGAARLRVVAIAAAGTEAAEERPGIALLQDAEGRFAASYGAGVASYLVRPDGHLGWRGPSWRDPGLRSHLRRIFRSPPGGA
jgi:hypothetical protein